LPFSLQDNVCCYDNHGIFSAPRVWWTFKVFGHRQVTVLDGGLRAWKNEGGRIEDTPPKEYPASKYPVPVNDESLVTSFEEITDIVVSGDTSVQILDARSSGRYSPCRLCYWPQVFRDRAGAAQRL